MISQKIKSPAKINLFLDILKKRADGYHDIRSLFSEIELSDTINFTLTEKDKIQLLTSKDFVSVEENLIYKVAIFIKKKYKVSTGVRIELEKNIPIAAGLGGGSSNAAYTIMVLSDLWNLNLSKEEMHDIAEQFGSDINFFIEGGCKLGEGRGEKISPIPYIFIDNIFLVNPGFGVSSQEAYNAVKLSSFPNSNWEELIKTADTSYCYNALEKGVCKLYPEIEEIINYLKANGAINTILSGSGATIIAFCPDAKIAKKFSTFYTKKNYWNYITKTKRSTR